MSAIQKFLKRFTLNRFGERMWHCISVDQTGLTLMHNCAGYVLSSISFIETESKTLFELQSILLNQAVNSRPSCKNSVLMLSPKEQTG